jgi:glycosyltransferase involved in cell wall biosynthesis
MNGSRRLAIFVPNMAGGGAERIMATLASAFAERGYKVDLLLANADGPNLSAIHPDVRVVVFGRRGVLACLPRLVRYLRRERPDALLSAMSHANVIALIAHRLAGSRARMVVSERASYAGMAAHYRSLPDRVIRFLMRRTYRRADAVIVVAKAMIDELRNGLGLDRSRVHMIANPVVTRRLLEGMREEPDSPSFRDGVPVILGAGRLEAQKDFGTLLRAFALLRADRDARLVIIGEGPERARLEGLARELGIAGDVALPGYKDNPYAYMRAAALFVSSSRFEGMPGVIIQAMACGTAVVSTDCPTGPREILEDGRWGALVPVGDAQRLCQAMAAALDMRDRPDVRERAKDFEEAGAVDRYLEILLADRRR